MIQNLSRNKEIVILKQDKDRGVVILDRNKYTEKCLSILSIRQLAKMNYDPTAYTEVKVQKALTKTKIKLPSFLYSKEMDHFPESFIGLLSYITLRIYDKMEINSDILKKKWES